MNTTVVSLSRTRFSCSTMARAVLALLLAATAASAATITVPGDQPTIQAAINVASPGDEIVISAGSYTESLSLASMGTPGDITIRAAAGNTVSITSAANTAPAFLASGFTGNVTLRDLAFNRPIDASQNWSYGDGAVVDLTNVSGLVVINNATFDGFDHAAVQFVLTGTTTGRLQVVNSVFSNSVDPNAVCILAAPLDSAILDLVVKNNSFSAVTQEVVQLDRRLSTGAAGGTGTIIARITGNTANHNSAVTGTSNGIQIDVGDNDSLNDRAWVLVDGNSLQGFNSDTSRVDYDGQNTAFNFIYSNNTTTDGSNEGLTIDADSTIVTGGVFNMLLDNNAFNTLGEAAIDMRPFVDDNPVPDQRMFWNAYVSNNIMTSVNGGGSDEGAFKLEFDDDRDLITVNLDLLDNIADGTITQDAYHLDFNGANMPDAIFNLGRGGSASNDLATVIADNNTGLPVNIDDPGATSGPASMNVVPQAVANGNVPGIVLGTVFEDLNADGLYGMEPPVGGVLVTLSGTETSSGTFISVTTMTDPDGLYMFPAVLPGSYILTVTAPAALPNFSPQNVGGNDSIDSDVSSSGQFTISGFTVGNQTIDVDAGIYSTPPSADLALGMVGSPNPVIAGNNLTYAITVTNSGPDAAANVVVTDTLPAGLGSATTAGCGNDPNGAASCQLGTIAAGASKQYTITAPVNSNVPHGAVLSNQASVSSSTIEASPGDESASATTTVNRQIDLQLGTTESIDPVVAGSGAGNLTYVLTVMNLGPSDASGVVIAEDLSLPPGVSRDSVTPSSGIFADTTAPDGTWSLDLAAGGTETLTIVMTAGASTAAGTDVISSTASVTAANETDGNAGNDSSTVATSVTAEADLTITKADDVDPVNALGTVIYTIEVSNSGPSDAANVVVTDTLPAGVSLDSTSGCSEDPNGVPSCALGAIAPGASKSFTVTVTVDGATAGTITNQASVTADTTLVNTGDDSVSEDTTVNAVATLVTTLTDSPDPVAAGTSLSYTIAVENSGPGSAADTMLYDVLPDGASYQSDTGGCAQPVSLEGLRAILSGANEVPPVVSPATGEAVFVLDTVTNTLNFAIHVAGLGNTITAAHIHLGAAGVNGPVVHTLYQGSPVLDDASPISGWLQLTPGEASDLLTQDMYVNLHSNALPAGELRGQLTTTAQGPLECNLGELAASAQSSFDVSVQVPADSADASTLFNSTIAMSGAVDPNEVPLPAGALAGSTTRVDTTVAAEADLVISAADSPDPVVAGTPLSYTVTVDNNGPSDAQNVAVTTTLPLGVSFVSTTGCAEDPAGVVSCSLGAIAAGGSGQFTVNVVVDSAAQGSLSAQFAAASSTSEASPGDESVNEITLVVEQADLALGMSDSPDPVLAGEQLTYVIQVSNNGPSMARNVVVNDSLPMGVSVVATTGCSEDPAGVPVCSLGSIPAGGSAQYTIVVNVDPSNRGSIPNQATVSTSAVDPNAANDTASETTQVNAEIDLLLVKTDSADPLPAGDPLVYTLAVTNNGPSDATNVVVTDVLPAGVTFASTSGCAEDPNGAPTCTLGTVNAGATVQYTLTVTVDPMPPPSITNSASVAATEPDTDLSNNSDDEQTSFDTDPPVVSVLSSIADTGDGAIDECESARVPITRLLVSFSEAVLDPAGDGDVEDVSNPGSYLVVAAGADGDFSTATCGAVGGDDLQLPISQVIYDSMSHTATLVTGGLPSSQVRVMVCATGIKDLAGNPLDGDGNGSGGDDFVLSFRSDPFNLLDNGHFDCPSVGLGGWTVSDPVEISTSSDDIVGSTGSGSAQVMQLAANTDFEISQCVPVTGGVSYQQAAELRMSTASFIGFSFGCEFFATASCGPAGTGLATDLSSVLISDTGSAWVPFTSEVQATDGAQSAECFYTVTTGAGADFTAWLDELFVGSSGPIFSDGFESGDTSQWSAAVP